MYNVGLGSEREPKPELKDPPNVKDVFAEFHFRLKHAKIGSISCTPSSLVIDVWFWRFI